MLSAGETKYEDQREPAVHLLILNLCMCGTQSDTS